MSGYKQCIVVRADIKMGKGKLAAQVAHAAVTAAEIARVRSPQWFEEWMREGQKKIVLKISSLDELLELYNKAERANLPVALVTDRGLTQLPPGTITALAIGPAPEELVDKLTRTLKLL
ncbi:MAG TPA: peptidyl-tRNA hydrolase [Thermofilaceae archaeon]|nr:peptidyl-tRNA hydrolase [Thermofilaceae archaeon]